MLLTTSISVSAIDLQYVPDDQCVTEPDGERIIMLCGEEAQRKIDLGLIERDECFDELESQVDTCSQKKASLRVFYGIGGVVVGILLGAFVSR